MKKTTAILLIILFTLGLCACNNQSKNKTESQTEAASATEGTTVVATQDQASTETSSSDSSTSTSSSEITDYQDNGISEYIDEKIIPVFSNLLTDSDYNNRQKQVGEYAYVQLDSGEMWIATPEYTMIDENSTGKDGKKGGDQYKTWYIYNEDGDVCFVLVNNSTNTYRYYIYNDEIIRYTVGSAYEGNQVSYDQGDSHIPDSTPIVEEAYTAYRTVKQQ